MPDNHNFIPRVRVSYCEQIIDSYASVLKHKSHLHQTLKQCRDPPTTEQNKTKGWVSTSRISGSFIQIAHFHVSFCRIIHPRLIQRESITCTEGELAARKKINKLGLKWKGKLKSVVTQLRGTRGEGGGCGGCNPGDYELESVWFSSVWLTLDGNILLYSFKLSLSHICCWLCVLTIVRVVCMSGCVYLAQLMKGDKKGYAIGILGLWFKPLKSLNTSTFCSALSEGLCSTESKMLNQSWAGNLAYLCGILLFLTF